MIFKLSSVVIVAVLPVVSAICPGGWVGVGTIYDNNGASGAIFANDWGVISRGGYLGDWCNGWFDQDVVVHCLGGMNSQPSYVHTNGGDFGGYDGTRCTGGPGYGENQVSGQGTDIVTKSQVWCCPPE